MSELEKKNIEMAKQEAISHSNKRKVLERLKSNPDFIEIILDGYLKTYPNALLEKMGDPSHQDSPVIMARMQDSLKGVSALHGYLNAITSVGRESEQFLLDLEEMENESGEENE